MSCEIFRPGGRPPTLRVSSDCPCASRASGIAASVRKPRDASVAALRLPTCRRLTDSATRPATSTLIAALALAVLAMSASAPLVRYAESPPLVVATWRMLLTAALHFAILRWREPHAVRSSGRERGMLWGAGLLLALHFGAWITSLRHTSVAASTVLVNIQPVFATTLAWVCLGERTSPLGLLGIALACCGAGCVLFDLGPDAGQLFGNLLALSGAVTGAGYYVLGRRLRQKLSVWAYTARVYAIAAAALLAMTLATGTPLWPTAPTDWLLFAGLAVGPSLLGHTLMNWSLRWLPAPLANVATLGEPIGAALLAYACFAEVPGAGTLLGGAVTLLGIGIAVRGAQR
jgi:drug/metabolite transporter (DMT)-like permease